jgi:hypothetical protein
MQEFVGPGVCTRCHCETAAWQQKTPMFQSEQMARDSGAPQQAHDLKPKRLIFSRPPVLVRLVHRMTEKTLYGGEFVALKP